MRTHKVFTVSLPPDMYEGAEERAKERGFKRSTYIQQLILADLRKSKAEKEATQKPTKRRAKYHFICIAYSFHLHHIWE